MNPLLDQLRSAVGAANVLTDGDLSAWVQEWRKRVPAKALAVVRPGSTAEVAAVVKACAAAGTSIVPQGGNTGLVLGSIPDNSGTQVLLSLQRMNRVRDIDAANLTMTVEAGCVLQAAQDAAEKAGLFYPLSLASEGSCTVGGNLSTNAGGTQVVRYGNARELCLGVEVVTAQGEVWNGLTGLRKDNTGYDLRDLFVGAEGTLGIITAATMKLYPMPAACLTAWAAVPTLEDCIALLELAQQHLASGLTGFEMMGQFPLQQVAKHFPSIRVPFHETSPYCVLLENSDHESAEHARGVFERLLEIAMEKGLVTDAVVAENITQARALWQIRETIPMAQVEEGLNIKHDISLAVSAIAPFCDAMAKALAREAPGARIVNFGHLGDGNLHYNVQAPVGVDPPVFFKAYDDKVTRLVHDMVREFGGSFSAEHGIGSLKLHDMDTYKSPVALGMMRAIKRALDPQNIMNPGRVVPLDARP